MFGAGKKRIFLVLNSTNKKKKNYNKERSNDDKSGPRPVVVAAVMICD